MLYWTKTEVEVTWREWAFGLVGFPGMSQCHVDRFYVVWYLGPLAITFHYAEDEEIQHIPHDFGVCVLCGLSLDPSDVDPSLPEYLVFERFIDGSVVRACVHPHCYPEKE